MPHKRSENAPASVDTAYRVLLAIYNKHRRKYSANPDSKQMCCMWSVSNLPDIIEGTRPLCDIEDAFGICIDEEDAMKIYDMDLDEAARTIMEMAEKNTYSGGCMAEYGEWNQKGATLSDATAKKEYGLDHAFIVNGINAGKLEYRESCVAELEKAINK